MSHIVHGRINQARGGLLAGRIRGLFGEESERNFSSPVPTDERQSISRAELQGVLQALRTRRGTERLVVILDSEYVYKGVTEWSIKWARHGWRSSGREIGNAMHAVRTQCEVLDVGKYSNPSFGPFSQFIGSVPGLLWLPKHLGCGIFELSTISP